MPDVPKLFDFVDAVSSSKKDLMQDAEDRSSVEKAYDPFMVSRALSYFPDSVLYANETNVYRDMPKAWHFDYHLGSLKPRKRFSRWFKKEKDEKVDTLSRILGTSREKAVVASSLISDKDLTSLLEQMEGK